MNIRVKFNQRERGFGLASVLGSLIIVAGAYVGWNLGANDGANAMGTAVGAGVRTIREAVILVAVFGFLGAFLFGHRVVKTVGQGIVPLDQLPEHAAVVIALAAMFGAGAWLQLATYLRFPVSTTHSAVGGVAGAGLAYAQTPIFWSKFADIVLAWLITPLGAAALAYGLYYCVSRFILTRWTPSDATFKWLLTGSGVYMAFTWGANDVANATGVMVGAGVLTSTQATILGGVAIAIGVLTWGHRVMGTIGSGITRLLPDMAFTAELAAAVNLLIYTALGFPVSTTHAIIGAIFGVGLVRGRAAVNMKTLRDIMLAWAFTPVAAGIVSFMLFKALQSIFL